MNMGWYPFGAFWLNFLFEQKTLISFGVALCGYYSSWHKAHSREVMGR